jgi:hypothetical protein
VIDCGGNRFRAQYSRIVGTLVLLNVGADSRFFNSVLVEPAIANYPSLLVQGSFRVDFVSNSLDESFVARNFNPPGTPYDGQEDSDQTDTYPSTIKGLTYVSGIGSFSFDSNLDGVMVLGGEVQIDSLSVTYDSTFLTTPPPGFGGPNQLIISPGSWRREAAP